jgi:hypothetical protein
MRKIILTIFTLFIVFCSFTVVNALNFSVNIKSANEKQKLNLLNNKEWTFMVYIAADNPQIQSSVYHENRGKLNMLSYCKSNEDYNWVFEIDTYDKYSGSKRFYVGNSTELKETLPEHSTGKAENLINFVSWAKTNYPANKYCLIVYSHGSGWRDLFCIDNTNNNDVLTMDELRSSMNGIKSVLGKNLDLFVMESCFMGMAEVYYQLRNNVDICIGSEDLMVNWGFQYNLALSYLENNPTAGPVTLAGYFVNSSADYYQGSGLKVTYAIVDINEAANALTTSIDNFAQELDNKFSTYRSEIKKAIGATKRYDSSYNGDTYILHFFDLYEFADNIQTRISDPSIYSKAQQVKDAISESIHFERHYCSSGNGISIYLPTFSLKFPYEPSYENLDFSGATHWDEFIQNTKNLILINCVSSSPFVLQSYNLYENLYSVFTAELQRQELNVLQ